jgi:hypothetical protein
MIRIIFFLFKFGAEEKKAAEQGLKGLQLVLFRIAR